jgi:hypothetical protein
MKTFLATSEGSGFVAEREAPFMFLILFVDHNFPPGSRIVVVCQGPLCCTSSLHQMPVDRSGNDSSLRNRLAVWL